MSGGLARKLGGKADFCFPTRSKRRVEFAHRNIKGSEKMDAVLETVEADALSLNVYERAALAQRLLASLDHDAVIEQAWDAEVERRKLRLCEAGDCDEDDWGNDAHANDVT